jgi:hypothetical protein
MSQSFGEHSRNSLTQNYNVLILWWKHEYGWMSSFSLDITPIQSCILVMPSLQFIPIRNIIVQNYGNSKDVTRHNCRWMSTLSLLTNVYNDTQKLRISWIVIFSLLPHFEKHKRRLMRSHFCLCVCVPLSLLGNGSVNTLPRQRIHTQ